MTHLKKIFFSNLKKKIEIKCDIANNLNNVVTKIFRILFLVED
jgi:hypothetical protein